ncbi:putative protein tyrosine phosphatase [Roseimicrobium gellanilyticum]|uniref:Phosphotyrosine protein phosphatase I domain-containing protein n=1 Tax=Roseimicrobium gellanilyticum TaxID=748857 RepID=A0A366HFN2_9BACT|nr:protein tyrosine phosphatase [Roseimicrobium gellanilyticum]RBP40494.1 putative protein tyrosine phosphatase [Roseimicrobium gellanilyticum]
MGRPVRFLFICSRNQWRSPTAEALFRNHPHVVARSAGTSPNAVHHVNALDLKWADVIFVMEPKHKQRVVAEFPEATRYKEMHVLDIPDDYQRDDPELVRLLTECLAPYLEK